MQKFSPKNVLITGATSGLGYFLATTFAKNKFSVVAIGRNRSRLSTLQKELSKSVPTCFTYEADINTQIGITLIGNILKKHSINILINNAAINPELVSGMTIIDDKHIEDIFTTNTVSTIKLSRLFFDYITTNGTRGKIINVNSVAGIRGSAHEQIYAASKYGLRGFSESVKELWLKQGVAITDIYSGAIATGMSAKRKDVASLIDPQELASFLVSMCETESFFIREIQVQKIINH